MVLTESLLCFGVNWILITFLIFLQRRSGSPDTFEGKERAKETGREEDEETDRG